MLERTVTPNTAPMQPGTANFRTRPRSMLRNRQCDTAATTPVTTFARLTVVDTAAGARPLPSRMLELVGPKPIPRAPSTSVAAKPAVANRIKSYIFKGNTRFERVGLFEQEACHPVSPARA